MHILATTLTNYNPISQNSTFEKPFSLLQLLIICDIIILQKGRMMNYLFIDIECCDGKHMCSLGGVLIDQNFHMIDKFDILINPQQRFKINNCKKDLKLFYPQDLFLKQPSFANFYTKIKHLLTLDGLSIIGFSILNDFNFINYACNRYGLKQLELSGFDVQLLYKTINHDNQVHSLERIANELDIPYGSFALHKSCDDAHLSMFILRTLCYNEKLDIGQILDKYSMCKVDSKLYIPSDDRCKKHKNTFKESFPQHSF